MRFRDYLLSEMMVHDVSTVRGPHKTVIAFRGHVWIGSYQDIEANAEEIKAAILPGHRFAQELDNNFEADNVIGWLSDYVPDAFVGYYNTKTGVLTSGSSMTAASAPLMKKLSQTLKFRRWDHEYADERTIKYRQNRFIGDWPKIAYHGTGTQYWDGIVRLGLQPMPHQTNYKAIVHDDLIFLSSNMGEAESHAFHTAWGGDESAINARWSGRDRTAKGLPMVVVTSIPDPNLIIPDYDIDRDADQAHYGHTGEPRSYWAGNSYKSSKHAGIFGYKGRIPSSQFHYIRVYAPARKTWLRLKPEQWDKIQRKLMNYGEDWWSMYFGALDDKSPGY